MSPRPPATGGVPRATYRLQLHPGFPFAAAERVVDDLAALGISHLYLSPILPAVPGSLHGYDVVAYDRVRDELGGEEGLRSLVERARAQGLGIVLDVVPNHAAASPDHNPWWRDVLEHGAASRYAPVFAVEWGEAEPLLLPLLDGPLEPGAARLERRGAEVVLAAPPGSLPVAPESLAPLLDAASVQAGRPELAELAARVARLPRGGPDEPETAVRRHAAWSEARSELARLLAEPGAAREVDRELADVSGDPERLAGLLDRQPWRLIDWRDPRRSYRRFFEVDDLVAVRADAGDAFRATHGLVLELVERGWVDGLRVDHVDGMRDPRAYLGLLRAAAPGTWTVVEKILAADERLPAEWDADGTTGYDFLNLVLGLSVDPRGGPPLRELFATFTGETRPWDEIVRDARAFVLEELFAPDLGRVVDAFARVAAGVPAVRGRSRAELAAACAAVLVGFDVYRTYVRPGDGAVAADQRERLERALASARRGGPGAAPADGELLEVLGDVLLLRRRGAAETELVERIQELAPALTAKAVEDTATYRYHPLACLNEVGGEPDRFGVAPAEFHAAMAAAAEAGSRSMLATSTHDTKRGEDVRARLALVSEVPGAWAAAVQRWAELAEVHRVGGRPDHAAEYLLYQTLVGAWPIGEERLVAYVEKAAREAKTHTRWRARDEAYEEALAAFARAVLAAPKLAEEIEAFVGPLVDAGRAVSLAWTLLKATAPGVPDVYQGCELWESSLVDPDNRRPVDFERRRRLARELAGEDAAAAWERRDEGAPKLFLLARALGLRRRLPGAFAPGSRYEPLAARGPRAEHAVVFLRAPAAGGGARVVAVAPRLVLGLGGDWQGTTLPLPRGAWRDVLGGGRLEGGDVPLGRLLARFPVALLAEDAG